MTNAIKIRILQDVRRRIEAGTDVYICLALDEIASCDHRRKIATFCDELKQQIQQRIAPHKSVGDWLLQKRPKSTTSLDDVKQARLATIDWAIACLQASAGRPK